MRLICWLLGHRFVPSGGWIPPAAYVCNRCWLRRAAHPVLLGPQRDTGDWYRDGTRWRP